MASFHSLVQLWAIIWINKPQQNEEMLEVDIQDQIDGLSSRSQTVAYCVRLRLSYQIQNMNEFNAPSLISPCFQTKCNNLKELLETSYANNYHNILNH